jgi:hypothetical protein
LFLVGHEYGHVALGHQADRTSTEQAEIEERRRQQEFEADQFSCGVVDLVLAGRGVGPPLRFMGAHFFLVSAMMVESVLGVLRSAPSNILWDNNAVTKLSVGTATHPGLALRMASINRWLERRYPTPLYRGTQFFAALFVEIAQRLWHQLEPTLVRRMEQENKTTPATTWRSWGENFSPS